MEKSMLWQFLVCVLGILLVAGCSGRKMGGENAPESGDAERASLLLRHKDQGRVETITRAKLTGKIGVDAQVFQAYTQIRTGLDLADLMVLDYASQLLVQDVELADEAEDADAAATFQALGMREVEGVGWTADTLSVEVQNWTTMEGMLRFVESPKPGVDSLRAAIRRLASKAAGSFRDPVSPESNSWKPIPQ